MPPLTKLWADDLEKKGVPAKAVLTQFMKSVRDHGGKPLRDWDKEV
jgi:hypothetical protein